MSDGRAERLARQIRSACGRYNDDDEPVVVCVAQMRERISELEAKLAAAEADAGRWMDVSVDGYPDKACKVLIARGKDTVLGAWVGDSFWYANKKVAALFWRHLPKPPDPRGDAAIDAARSAK